MNIIDQIKAEIERRIKSWQTRGEHSPEGQGKDTCVSRVTELTDLLSFLDTLEKSENPINPTIEKLRALIKMQIRREELNFASLGGGGQTMNIGALEWVLKQLDTLQEQPVKNNALFDSCLAKVNPETREEVRKNIDKMIEQPVCEDLETEALRSAGVLLSEHFEDEDDDAIRTTALRCWKGGVIHGANWQRNRLLPMIDNICKGCRIQHEKENPVCDGLEEEIQRFLSNATKMDKGEWKGKYPISEMGFGVVARHFYELGRQSKEQPVELEKPITFQGDLAAPIPPTMKNPIDRLRFMEHWHNRHSQVQPVCEELEEEIKRWLKEGKITDTRYDDYNDNDIEATARHFAQWQMGKDLSSINKSYESGVVFGMNAQKEQMMKETPVSDDLEEAAKLHRSTANYGGDINLAMEDSYKKGAKWQKEQMMKEAVEGEVYLYHSYNRNATAIVVDIPKENLGDNVRIIICKKED